MNGWPTECANAFVRLDTRDSDGLSVHNCGKSMGLP